MKAKLSPISVILTHSVRLIVQVMLLISILLVIRGHNHPGGGFIGALIASAAVCIQLIAEKTHIERYIDYFKYLVVIGLSLMLLCLFIPLLLNHEILTGVWWDFRLLGSQVKFGTPILFDFGVYFLIFGSLSWLITELEEE